MKQCLWSSGKSGEDPEIKDKQFSKNSVIFHLHLNLVETVSLKDRRRRERKKVSNKQAKLHQTPLVLNSVSFSTDYVKD